MQVMSIASMVSDEFGGQRDLSGLGGVETGRDAAEFILIGSNSVQVVACLPACDSPVASMGLWRNACVSRPEGHSHSIF